MTSQEQILELVKLLNQATKDYEEGHPTMSDKEWDSLYFRLEKLEKQTGLKLKNSPTQTIQYEVKNKLEKVKHNHLMLSLDKTKDVDVVKSFLGARDWVALAKLDGLTCSLTYENGQLVRAETRGNGEIGEDILHNAKVIPSIPKTISYTKRVVIDGEIICTYKNFEQYKDEFKNPRNYAAGSIRLLDSHECKRRKLTFIAWDVIEPFEDLPYTLIHQLGYCEDLGFKTPPVDWYPSSEELMNPPEVNLESIIEYIKSYSEELGYPIDGVVFKFDDLKLRESLGATSHHFNNAIAYKFYDEEYDSILKNIEWTIGRTGVYTPVAVFEPIDDGESIITRASLHNLSILKKILGNPYVGEQIKVIKANQIIPQITYGNINTDSGIPRIALLKTCPICGSTIEIKQDNDSEFLICPNDKCEGKLINQIDHFVGKKGLDIKGLSKATLEKLINLGWVTCKLDIFSLEQYRAEWVKLPGFGEKSVGNILSAIEAARTCELHQFISALGIPLIGSTYAKDMCKNEFDWFNIREDVAGGYDFTQWEGFGPEMNAALHAYDYTEADKIAELLTLTNSLWNMVPDAENLKVCITGNLHVYKNRVALTQAIEKIGGRVVSSVSRNTTLLINNDINSNSTKNITAKKLGIPIMTEEIFQKNYLTK